MFSWIIRLTLLTGVAASWRRLERAHEQELMSIRVHLRPEIDLLEQLNQVADIASPEYAKYVEDLDQVTRPSSKALDAARLLFSEFHPIVSRNVWHIELPVASAETLFQTKIHKFQHDATKQWLLRAANSITIPQSIASHVLLIDGLDYLPPSRSKSPFKRRLQGVNPITDGITLEIIQKLYNFPDSLDSSYAGNSIVIGAFLNETYMESDIDNYLGFSNMRPLSVKPSHKNCIGNGKPNYATSEASLDVQLLAGLTRNNDTTVLCYNEYRIPDKPLSDDNQEPFLKFMIDVNTMKPAPAVVSISYADDECSIPLSYRQAIDSEFIKAGLRGTTIFVSSGDNGVVGSSSLEDFGPKYCDRYQPGYPSSSPYIVSVGATNLVASKEIGLSTRNGGAITTGGGFSQDEPRPVYQVQVVDEYLGKHNLNISAFNSSGRAFPDLAGVGHNIVLFIGGFMTVCDGTSASAPILAALFSHINRYRLSRGKPVLGFVNPYLYKLSSVCPFIFNDIASGENGCGSLNQPCCLNGFAAGLGWDPISGLGSLNYQAFIDNMDKCEELMKA
ncbi:tripeptidyl-peptidase [Thraustotheca clavata]|uniref:subtilisin n=1 Tax=Thraustotheca clavata TaxID=74557 RepID=A0A1V9ZX58_9STRA|nr:tripeptidyl-peptidase [Thraustotheca clavata]